MPKIEVKLVKRVPNGSDGLGWGNSESYQYVKIMKDDVEVMQFGFLPKHHAKDLKKKLEKVIELARST